MDLSDWRKLHRGNDNEMSGSYNMKIPLCSRTGYISGSSAPVCQPLASDKGFTLVELIVVVAILGVLATMAIPAFSSYITSARCSRATADLRTIDTAISAYILENNTLPAGLANTGISTLLDPWGRPYVYQVLGGGVPPLEYSSGLDPNTDYDLYSKGEDGLSDSSSDEPHTNDDIVRASSSMFVGLRSLL